MPLETPGPHTDVDADASKPAQTERDAVIQAVVQEIFLSAPFRASRQCQDLLRYIVTHTVAGDDQLLRERVIGMEVFARKPDYDTGEDPVVRLRASELRKRLAQFYQSDSGKSAPMQISIPSGSYRANFVWLPQTGSFPPPISVMETQDVPLIGRSADTTRPGPKDGKPELAENPGAGRRPLKWAIGLALLGCAIAGGFSWRASRVSALNQFWGPLMADSHPTLVCMGSNAVYRLSNNFLSDYEKRTGEAHDGIEFLIDPIPGQKLDQRDLLRANNSFVALGDVAAASQFASFLGQRGKSFTERFPPDMSFAEIQEFSSVLIGGFNNQMTLTVTKNLPFVMKGSDRIEERANPQRAWKLQFYGDARESEDYALISRLIDPSTQHEIVALGGIGQYGTQAAADFLTDPASITALAEGLPKGWRRKNLQIILHVKVVDYRPVQREVLSTKVW